jgi:hypothetical protein
LASGSESFGFQQFQHEDKLAQVLEVSASEHEQVLLDYMPEQCLHHFIQ